MHDSAVTRVALGEGIASLNPLILFHHRAWFDLLVGLGMLVMIGLLSAWRIRNTREKLRLRMQERRSERERIARELHDTLLQGVQALSFRMKRWAIDPAIPESQQREIERVVSQTDSIIIAGREKILELRQMSARPRELLRALSEVGAASAQEGAPILKVATAGNPRPLNARASEEVYHIAAEAIRNACQHSGASVVTVSLDYHRRTFALSISDDGQGMTVPARAPAAHYGLIGMQERAELIGGTLSIRSEPSRGTIVSLLVSRDSVYE